MIKRWPVTVDRESESNHEVDKPVEQVVVVLTYGIPHAVKVCRSH